MPSPFPGMDPFLEGAEWEDFHTRYNLSLNYATRLDPPWSESDRLWFQQSSTSNSEGHQGCHRPNSI
jgi:hypothetical protein